MKNLNKLLNGESLSPKELKNANKEFAKIKSKSDRFDEIEEDFWDAYTEDGEPKEGHDLCTIGERLCEHFGTL